MGGVLQPLIGAVDDFLQKQRQTQIGAGQPPPAPVNTGTPRIGAVQATPPTFNGSAYSQPKIGAAATPQPAAQPVTQSGMPGAPTDTNEQPPTQGSAHQIGAGAQPTPNYAARYHDWAASEPAQLSPDAGKPSMLRKIGGIALGAGIGAFSPQAGGQIGSAIVNGPRRELQAQHQQAEDAWNRQGKEITQEASLADTGSQIRQRDADALKAERDANQPPKPGTPEEQAFNQYVAAGETPAQARTHVLKDAESVKPQPGAGKTLDEQYDAAVKAGDTAAAQRILTEKSSLATAGQAPERPQRDPRQLAVGPDGKVIELKPGVTVPQGTKTVAGDLATGKPTADEQRRADLAENLNENLDKLTEIATRRPDLFGPIHGRMTSLKGFIGSDDPDVATLETIKHQIGMAQISAHGMRSAQGVESAAESIINSFKNGPDAVKASAEAARNSVKTFTGDVSRAQNKTTPQGSAANQAPEGASDEVYAKDGTTLIGHVVNGKYVPLNKK